MKKVAIDLKLKQLFMVFLCMAVIFTAMPVMPVYAETEDTPVPSISVSGNSAYAGSSVQVNIQGSDFSNIGAMEFQIHYDPDVMTVYSCSASSLMSSSYYDINTSNPGEIRIMTMSLDGISGSGRLAYVYFNVNSDVEPGDYPVTITVGSVSDTAGEPVVLNKTSGTITVKERPVNPTSITFNRSCDKTSVQQGDTLNYTLKSTYGYGLTAGNFVFTYDSSLLKLNSVTLGETLDTETSIAAINSDTPGYVKVSFADLQELPIYYGNELVKLNFTVIGDVDETTYIDFSADTLCDYEGNAMISGSHSQSITLKKKAVVIDYPDFKLTANEDFDEDTRTFTVDVSLEEGAYVAAGDFFVSYDENQVVCTGITPTAEASTGTAMFSWKQEIDKGTVKFSYINQNPVETDLKLATLTFKAADGFVGDTVFEGSGSGVKDKLFTDIILDYPETTVSVPKLKAEITGTAEYSKTYGDGLFKLDAGTTNTDSAAVLTYTSGNTKVAQVSTDGEVLIVGAGTAVITVSCQETENYKACSGIVTVTVEQADISEKTLILAGSAEYTGKPLEPAVSIDGLVAERDFTVKYDNNTNVGTADVTVTGKGNYKGELKGTFEITRATLHLSAEDIQLGTYDDVYDGSEKKPEVTIKGMTYGTDYTVSYTNNVNAGTATVTVTGTGNYSGSATKNFTINQASLSGKKITLIDTVIVYDGQKKEPRVKVEGLNGETDYTASYKNNIQAGEGTATVTVTGKGNYKDSASLDFTIDQANISTLSLSVAGPVVYTGSALKPAVTISGLVEGRDFTVDYSNNTNVGTASVTVTGHGNYKGELTGTFEITAAGLGLTADDIQLGEYDQVYDGKAKEPEVTIKDMIQGTDYTVSYTNNINAGEATVTVTGCGNYSGSATKTFTINQASLSGRVLTLTYDAPYIYDNTAKEPAASISGLTMNTDFTVSYTNNKNAGEATVTATGKGNYTGTTAATFIIERALIPEEHISVSGSGEYEYTGNAFTPRVAVGILKQGTDYKVTYQDNTNAGTAKIFIEGTGNYKGTFERTFTIHPTSIRAYEWDAVLSQESYTYDGQAKTPKVTIADGNLVENTDFEVTYLTNVDAGQAAAQVTGKGNYKDSFRLFFGIDPAQITKEMVQLGAYEKVYDGNAKNPEAIVGGGKLTEGTDYEVSYSNNTNAGDKATVTVIGKDNNYTGEVTIYFEITAALLNDDMFSLANVPVTYNGSMHAPDVIAAEGLEYGSDYTVTYGENTAAGEDAGTVTIEGRGNYAGTVKKDFAINPAALTEADVSLAYTQTGYNGSAQTPGVTVSKFGNELKEGTEFEVVSYADNTNVGTATVTIQGKGNFTGTIQKKFEILQHGLTAQDIKLEDYEAIYNGQPHTPKVTIDGHVEGTDFEVSYDKNTNAGTADVIVKGITNHSGEVTLHFTIKPADLRGMKAELRDFDPVYDGTAKEPSVTVEGLKDSDYNVTYSNNTNVGEATVTIEGKENYTGVIELNFNITPKSLESGMFSLSGGPFVYNGKQHTPVVNAEDGLEAGSDYTVSYGDNTAAGEDAGIVTITGCGNYTGTVTKKFNIEKAAIDEDAISLAYPSVTYNGQAKEPEVTIKGLEKGTDFEVEYTNNVNAGKEAKVTITGKGNYTGEVAIFFEITAASLNDDMFTLEEGPFIYNGSQQTPAVNAAEELKAGADYTVTYGENVNAGEAAGTVTITGQGNYTGTVTAHFNIDPAKLNAANVKLGEYEQTYDGTAKEPQVIINGLEAGTDYTVAYADNVNAGTGTVTITGKENYTGEVTICFEITAASLNDDMFALEEGPFVYNGSKHTPAVNAAEELEAEHDYTVTYGENVNAGLGAVTITGKGNYSGTVTKEFAIDRATFSKDDVTLSDTEIEYTGNPQGPNVMVEGLIKDQDYTVEYHNNEDAGQATVTVMGIGNYTGQYELTFTIKPAVLTEADASLAYIQTGYNGTEQTPAVTVTKFGETLEQGTHYDVTYSDNKNAGEATVTIEGKGNYTGSVALKFTITEQGLAADDVHLKYLETFYDGTEKKPEVEIKGLAEGDDFSVEYADNINVGTAKVTVIGKGNHSGEVKLTFTIKPADLSDLTAVLGEYHSAYDGSAKTPAVTIEGLKEGTDYTVSYENNVNAGTKASVVITGKGNYTGTLTKYFTIEALKLDDWADALTLEYLQAKYDGTAKKPAVTIEGLTAGDDFTVSYSNNVEAGKALVTITGKGNYEGQLTAEFEIIDFDVLLGDVNLDGRVSAADLTMLARHVSGIRPVTDIRSLTNADVTLSDGVGVSDLTKLARYVAKIITAL